MTNKKPGIYTKMAKVMKEVGRVPKNGYNSYHKYEYVTESDLVDEVRGILADEGIAFFSTVLDQERSGEFTKVKMKFVMVDIETGETIESVFWGEGQDRGDKGLYKAYTGATKYFLMKNFLIATGDDPEADTSTDERNEKKGKGERTAKPKEPEKNNKSMQVVMLARELGMKSMDIREMVRSLFGKEDLPEMTGEEMEILLESLKADLKDLKEKQLA